MPDADGKPLIRESLIVSRARLCDERILLRFAPAGAKGQGPMDALDRLFAAARAAQAKAYAPYSGFPVGAALRTESGAIFSGCNVENAASPNGLCAESAAIAAMIGAGERRIAEALVVGPAAAIAPCGACRQRLLEFAVDGAIIHLADASGARESHRLGALLPRAFGPGDLRRHKDT